MDWDRECQWLIFMGLPIFQRSPKFKENRRAGSLGVLGVLGQVLIPKKNPPTKLHHIYFLCEIQNTIEQIKETPTESQGVLILTRRQVRFQAVGLDLGFCWV